MGLVYILLMDQEDADQMIPASGGLASASSNVLLAIPELSLCMAASVVAWKGGNKLSLERSSGPSFLFSRFPLATSLYILIILTMCINTIKEKLAV